MGRKDITT